MTSPLASPTQSPTPSPSGSVSSVCPGLGPLPLISQFPRPGGSAQGTREIQIHECLFNDLAASEQRLVEGMFLISQQMSTLKKITILKNRQKNKQTCAATYKLVCQ